MDTKMSLQAGTSPLAPPKRAAVSSDYTTFLKMLTTQMQNQDPLDPMDSGQYAQQLASFSSVEQQTKTNQLLEGLAAQFGLMNMAQLAGWVGQDARSSAAVFKGEGPVTLAFSASPQADKAVLVVKDLTGKLVSRETVPLSSQDYRWLGASQSGDLLDRGSYTLSLENYVGETLLGTSTVESYQRITEVRNTPEGTKVILAGGIAVKATDVTALRVP
jgi:flagellar basal-body rod modification protein FlgD